MSVSSFRWRSKRSLHLEMNKKSTESLFDGIGKYELTSCDELVRSTRIYSFFRFRFFLHGGGILLYYFALQSQIFLGWRFPN